MDVINFGIFAHVDAGKTTLTEQILFQSGMIRKAGSVDGGTAQTDFMDVECRRKISVNAAAAEFEWKGLHFNLIDTPGHADFGAGAERSLNAMDCAVVVVSGVEGVQARTELICAQLAERRVPVIYFVNKLDRAGADFQAVCADLKELDNTVTPFVHVSTEGNGSCEIASLLSAPLPDTLAEAAALCDDGAAEAYLSGELTDRMALAAFKKGCTERNLSPVFAGSAAQGVGIAELLDGMAQLFPISDSGDERLAGIVFKIDHDKTMGRIAHVRLYSGELEPRETVELNGDGVGRKVTQIRKFSGRRFRDIPKLCGGDIGAVCGLDASVGDILGDESLIPQMIRLSQPLLTVKTTVSDADYSRLAEAVDELAHEEPLLAPEWVREKRELTLNVTGTIQLEVLSELLEKRYGLAVTFGKPSVIYRETPVAAGYGFDAYTMPKPCWAVLKFLIEPLPAGSGVEYKSIVANNKIFYRYQSQVEQAIPTALRQGPSGWQVVDLRLTLVDGSHHTIHTHPLDFIVATPMAVMNGLNTIGTKMLEPTLRFRLTVPEEAAGRVMNEIINLRGELDEMPVSRRGRALLEGELPVATSSELPLFIAKVTGGRGVLATRFCRYRDCPQELCTPTEYRGISPLDRAKYILWVRHALENQDMHL